MSSTRRDSPSSGFGATREDFAAGDVLIRFPLAEIPRLLILSPIVKPGWRGRVAGTQTRALFPGSAVRFEGRFYEVRRVTPNERDGTTRYELWPWEDQFLLREVFDYTREECERVAAFVRAVKRKQAGARSLAWLLPLVGLLPARLQTAIEEEYGLPAARATYWSALILLGAGGLAVLTGVQCLLALVMGGAKPGSWSLGAMHWLPLSVFLTIESAVRYRMSHAEIALGSAPVALPIHFALVVWDALRPHAPVPRPSAQPRRLDPQARDEVRDLADGRLEILSPLDKPHWGPRTAIHFRGAWWALAQRDTPDAVTSPRRWRFVIEPWPEHALVQDPVEYHADEIHGLAFDRERDRHRSTVESLGACFGLLPIAEQTALAEIYGYHPRSATGWSILGLGLGAMFTLWVAAGRLAGHAGGWVEWILAALAAGLLVESAARALAWFQGRIAASVLAPLVRPLSARVLDLGRQY